MLTKQQRNLLLFMDSHLKANGIIPSYEEMQMAVNLKSKSGIHRLIKGLEERGFIRKLPNKARAIEILKLPEKIITKNGQEPTVNYLPLYGKIAAGTPIEALKDESKFIEVPVNMVGAGNHYALEIEGESMIDAGIFNGDYVIIKQEDIAREGEIVVALVDGNEATLKYWHRKDDKIALKPANKDYEVRYFNEEDVQIQGKLVGLIRRY